MKRLQIILAATLVFLGCGRALRPGAEVHVKGPEPTTSVDADTAAQNRINSFFYAAVLPRLAPCWKRVEGTGEIDFKFTYRRVGTNWVWQQQEVATSTLPKGQEAIAFQCMQDAARDTSFPMEAAEAVRGSKELVLDWTWPVPFPPDVSALGRMIDTGKGGGRECTKSCVNCNCPFIPGTGTRCECASSCSGYTAPCALDADGKGCTMKLPECKSGRFGLGGGAVVIH
jgi:hypothetical protein